MKKTLLSETSWGDEASEEPQEGGDNSSEAASSAFENVQFLNKLDDQFNSVYKEVTKNSSEDLQLFSAKMQKMELATFAKNVTKKLSPEVDDTQDKINELMNSDNGDILKVFDDMSVHSNRKKLYDMYQEISNINSIAYRMLQVYINNILVKNGQTKQFLNVIENEYNQYVMSIDEEVRDNIKKFIKTMILYFDLQPKLKNKIVPETLKMGDYYIEIVDLAPIDSILDGKISLLSESIEIEETVYTKQLSLNSRETRTVTRIANLAFFEDCTGLSNEKNIDENINPADNSVPANFNEKMARILSSKNKNNFIIEENDLNFLTDVMSDGTNYDTYTDFDLEKFQELNFDGVEDIYLRLLSPANVLKIEKDGNHYGFLIVEDIDDAIDPNNEIDMYQRFLSDDSNGGSTGSTNPDINQEEALASALVDSITNKLAEAISKDSGFLSDMPDELKSSLRLIAYEKIRKKAKLKFRFMQANKLVNFHTSIDKYKPYGTSIFDPIVLHVKMYTIAMMSSVISRLSRAAVVRKWNIEVGTKRNYPEIIEKVKKDLKTKSISYDDLGSIRSISQVLTDYRDIAVVSQNGQRFVDMEIMPMHDRALPMNDMMDLRNDLVAATGVPSVYLNIGDSIELRETLVNINIGFSHTISNLQGNFEDSINELLNVIFEIILQKNALDTDFKLSQFFKVTMNHPLVLQLQSNESVLSTVSNMIGLLKQADISFDPIMLFKKYLPDMSWEEIEKSGEESIKKEVKNKLMQAESGGGY